MPSNTRIKPYSEDLHAQECTHMNDIAYHVCPDLKKKKKKDQPTNPPNFRAKRANKPFIFLGRIVYIYMYIFVILQES